MLGRTKSTGQQSYEQIKALRRSGRKSLPVIRFIPGVQQQTTITVAQSRNNGDDQKLVDDSSSSLRVESRELEEMYSGLKEIGEGNVGKVYCGQRQSDHELVAIKVVHTKPQGPFHNPFREIELTRRVMCADPMSASEECSVVPIHDTWINANRTRLMMEMKYIPHDAYQIIARQVKFPKKWTTQSYAYWEFIRRNFICLVSTLNRIHALCELHRDIKPDNLLFDRATERLYLADFGAACIFPKECNATLGGTKQYIDPALYLYNVASNASSDVYSLGVTMYELLMLQHLNLPEYEPDDVKFPTEKELEAAFIEATARLEKCIESDRTERYKVMFEILAHMIDPLHPENRPTLSSILDAMNQDNLKLLQYDNSQTRMSGCK